MILPADKGRSTVVMDRADYEKKALQLLSDGPYAVISQDPTLSLERKITKQLLDLKCRDVLPNKVYFCLCPSGSRVPQLYGLPKIHKDGIPLRPIVAVNGSVSYQLAKHLAQLLQPLCGNSGHHVKDSSDFSNSISSTRIARNEVMISFDVAFLFISVPVKEALRVTNTCLLSDSTLEDRSPIPIVDIMRLLEFCIKNTYFQFRGTIYEQTEGLVMGSRISPVLANLYMEEFEQRAMRYRNSPRVWKNTLMTLS